MSVLLPNVRLTVHKRQHAFTRDPQGMPVAPPTTTVDVGPLPGSVRERPESGTWSVRLEPVCYPVRAGDELSDELGRRWTVTREAQLYVVVGHSAADYVSAEASLNPPRTP